jgi:streptogramin lyase
MNFFARPALAIALVAMLAGCSSHGVTPAPLANQVTNESLLANRDGVEALVSPLTPHVANEFPLPGVGDVIDIARGNDGFIWFSDDADNLVGRVTSLGVVTKYVLPGNPATDFPYFMTLNSDGNLWVVHDYANLSPALARVHADGTIKEFTLTGIGAGGYAKGITHDAGGNLWVAVGQQRIVEMDQFGHVFANYKTPTSHSGPFGMCYFGGLIWIMERHANQVAAINNTGNFIGEFPIPTAGARPGQCVGLGNYVYFPEPGAPTGKLGRIDISSHVVSEVSIPNPVSGLAVGPSGGLWMAQGTAGKIAHYNPATGLVTQYSIPNASAAVVRVALGGDGNVYFPEDNATVNCTTSSPCKMAQLIPH